MQEITLVYVCVTAKKYMVQRCHIFLHQLNTCYSHEIKLINKKHPPIMIFLKDALLIDHLEMAWQSLIINFPINNW